MIIVTQGDAANLPFPDDSIDCIVTSPPYNVGIEYAGYHDRKPWMEYLKLATDACNEMARVLVPGGRVWLNVPAAIPFFNAEMKATPWRAAVADVWSSRLGEAGLSYRDTIAWIQDSHDGACAWGSWLSPSAPNLRGGWESILLWFKESDDKRNCWKRPAPPGYENWSAPRRELGGDWPDLCRNVWYLAPSRSKDSPAAFPLDLPARCIRLGTWPGQTVLDPFGGSGTTAEAAHVLGRVGISLDCSREQTRKTADRLTYLF